MKTQRISQIGQGLLTVEEVASYLACSTSKVYRLAERGEMLSRKLGKSLRFRLADVDAWVEKRKTVPPLDPLIAPSLNVELALEKYDKLYLKGGSTLKSKGQKRWNYPFGSVYVRSSRSGKERWHIYYRLATGKYVRKAVKEATSRVEALKVLQKKATEAFANGNGVKLAKEMTFEDFSKLYLENTKHLKDWATNDYRMKKILVPCFGKFNLKDITPQHIEDFRRERLAKVRKGKKIKPITTNRDLALLKVMFTKAIDYGYASTNPVKRVKMIPESDCARERILTPAEERTLLEKSAQHFRPFLVVALNTGMRRGEILNLGWPQIDFEKRVVYVIKTKSGKNRRIPMNDTLYHTLRALKTEANGAEKIYPFKYVQGAFEKAREDADLSGLRLHDLRHTFATRLIQSGANPFTVQKILGHSTITMTMRYVHPSEDLMRDAVANLERNFAQSLHNFETQPVPVSEAGRATRVESVS